MAMKLPLLVAFLSLAHLARSDENDVTIGAGVTPVQKVLDLLASMKVRGEEEKQKEALQYAKYEQFCANTQEEKQKSLKDTASQIEILKADLGKISSDIADAEATLPDLTKDIDKWTADKDTAAKERQEERLSYTKAHGEYLKAIQNVGKAYTTLKSQDVDKEQAKSFIQFPDLLEEGSDGVSAEADALSAPSGARAAIQAFLAENSEISVAAEGPGKAKGYEFGSDKILDLLKQLEGKFKKERMTMEKEEMDKKHSYELLLQTWKSQIAGAEKTRDDKVASKLKKEQTKASKEKDLADLVKLNEDDTKYLEDVKVTCTQKAEDFKERQGLRGEELAAIDKAADAIRGTVLKVSEKGKSKKGTALAALRSDFSGALRDRAVALLRQRAEELDSNTLSSLALRVEGDGLGKIKKMISSLVNRLQEEAAADTEKDGWCKKELATNEQARTSKKQQMDTLQGEVDQLEVDITELGDSVDGLSKDITKLVADREESEKLRQAEKEENEETIKDAQDAQKAIAQAVAALDSFYSGAVAKASKTALLQDSISDAPDIFEGSYTGMDGGGVNALLEVLEADFARLETETKAAEAQSLGEHTKFMSDSKVDKAAKEKEVELKTETKNQKANQLKSKKIDLADAGKALSAANKYLEELKPECLKPAMTKEEKMEQRKQEIESLKEVLEILQG